MSAVREKILGEIEANKSALTPIARNPLPLEEDDKKMKKRKRKSIDKKLTLRFVIYKFLFFFSLAGAFPYKSWVKFEIVIFIPHKYVDSVKDGGSTSASIGKVTGARYQGLRKKIFFF